MLWFPRARISETSNAKPILASHALNVRIIREDI